MLCGAVPLLPYLLGLATPLLWASVLTATVFFGIGSAKSLWSLDHWTKSGAETLAIGDVEAPFVAGPDSVTLRVFVDKGMVEVFADDRQAMIGTHDYHPENVHLGLFADDHVTADVAAWRLDSIYVEEAAARSATHNG